MKQLLVIVVLLLVTMINAGCVTSIDAELPYAELPSITVATEFTLVASPAHPTAYLPVDPIPAGAEVHVLGADEDAAWLLVEYGGVLGWMPAFYSRTNIGTLEQALVFESPADKCTKFLDAVLSLDEGWTPGSTKSAIVVGSIFRDEAGERFDDASLLLVIDGPGSIIGSDYVHTPLTVDTAIVLFSYTLQDLQSDSHVRFRVAGTGDEQLSFQAFFFENECASELKTLPIGQARGVTASADVSNQKATILPARSPTPQPATPTPEVIKKESGQQARLIEIDAPAHKIEDSSPLFTTRFWLDEVPMDGSLLTLDTQGVDHANGIWINDSLIGVTPQDEFERVFHLFVPHTILREGENVLRVRSGRDRGANNYDDFYIYSIQLDINKAILPRSGKSTSVEIDSGPMHFGNDTINSWSVPEPENLAYIRFFELSEQPKIGGVLRFRTYQVDCLNPIRINDNLLGNLAGYGRQEWSSVTQVYIPARYLEKGGNSLRIDVAECNGRLDDFMIKDISLTVE